jgi:hypothetical protein
VLQNRLVVLVYFLSARTTRTKAKTMKHGHRMISIANYVASNPGCSILTAALATKPTERSGHMSGYEAAHRALRAGLIKAEPGPRNSYRLLPNR